MSKNDIEIGDVVVKPSTALPRSESVTDKNEYFAKVTVAPVLTVEQLRKLHDEIDNSCIPVETGSIFEFDNSVFLQLCVRQIHQNSNVINYMFYLTDLCTGFVVSTIIIDNDFTKLMLDSNSEGHYVVSSHVLRTLVKNIGPTEKDTERHLHCFKETIMNRTYLTREDMRRIIHGQY
jgi:hypothetical protein